MPNSDLKQLGQQLKTARNEASLTQEQLSDLSHVSIKHIAGIEKGQKNPSFEILIALSKVLKLSLDGLITPDMSEEEKACKQLVASYMACPPAAREILLKSTQSLANELIKFVDHTDIK